MAEGLKEAFQQAAKAAFAAAGTIKEEVTLRCYSGKNSTYTPSTNTISNPYRQHRNIQMIFTDYNIKEVDGQTVLATDIKAKCLVNDLDDIPATPKMNDEIIRIEYDSDKNPSDVVWNIINLGKDAADAVWTFQIRRP